MYLRMVYTHETFNILVGRKEASGRTFVYYYQRGERDKPALTDSYREYWF